MRHNSCSVSRGGHSGWWISVVGPTETIESGQSGQSCKQPAQVADRHAAVCFKLFFDGNVEPAVHPVEPERRQPPHRSLASQHRPRQDLVLGLVQFVLGHPLEVRRLVKIGDTPKVRLGLSGLTAQKSEERAGLVIVLVRKLGAVGQPRVDQAPVQPRSSVVAQDGPQQMRSITVRAFQRRPAANTHDRLLLIIGARIARNEADPR